MKPASLSAVDLFCGSGGLSAGLIDSGIDVLAAYDDWEAALATYKRNIGDHAHHLDLADAREAAGRIAEMEPDLIAGGPPCQDFSSAGKRKEGGRANLTCAFGEIVLQCKPFFFLMENVPQARLSAAYKSTKSKLEKNGYGIDEIVLNASRCGVPQARKRLFMFGSLVKGASGRFIQFIDSRFSDRAMTVKDYLGSEIDVEYYYRHPRNYSRRSVFSVDEPSPTIRGVNRPVPPHYKGNHLDSVPPSEVRALTSLERSRIQTFPASWDWSSGNRNAGVELQIGNAVPVKLAAFVAAAIGNAA